MNEAPFLPYRSTGETVAKVLSDIIQNRFNGLVEANGQSIVLNRNTGREWRYSKEAKYLKYNKNGIYRDKLKSIGNADELLTTANNWIGEEAKHNRNDNFVEFARGNVFYKVGKSGYSADVVVGIRSDGVAVLHDLVNIWKTKITEAPYTSQSTKYSADRTGTSVITDNVSQSDGEVKYSFSGNGYNGYSMSNNAVYAYENGEKPISKWTKSDILSEIANIDEEKAALVKDIPLSTLKQNLLYNSSYHHTSSHYNKTQFYAVDADVVDSLTPETVAEWKNQKPQG